MLRKNEKGITLVALVITIIVLLILAGVTISLVIGENVLITRSKTSAETYKNSAGNETNQLNTFENEFNYLINDID